MLRLGAAQLLNWRPIRFMSGRPQQSTSDKSGQTAGLFGRQLNFGSLVHSVGCESYQGCSRKIRESRDRALAVIGVAIWIAIAKLRSDLSQVACSDWFTAQRAESLLSWRLVIHQYELHVAPPSAKQNTVSDGWKPLGGGAQRWFRPSGWSLFRS